MKVQLIEQEGRFYKECGVVMLKATNESNLYLTLCRMPLHYGSDYFHEKNTLIKIDRKVTNFVQLQPQHLYITSDDEIKEGDWCLFFWDGGQLGSDKPQQYQPSEGHVLNKGLRKIIATTDTSLGLPQPSDKFIQAYIDAYNKGEKIEKVLVEVERYISSTDNSIKSKPKLKDNNIITIINNVKDSWTREEVISLCKMAAEYGYENELDNEGQLTDKWFDENL